MDYREPFLPASVRNAIIAHMREDMKVEACGLITLSGGDYSYEKAPNTHPDPENFFRLDNDTRVRALTDASVVAYVHTHPKGPSCPSKFDMEVQMAVGKPSVICTFSPKLGTVDIFSFGDHLLDVPLFQRDYRHGVFDCYSALRAWKWQKEGEKTPDQPREDGWWNVGKGDPEKLALNDNLYLKNFSALGYEEVVIDVKTYKQEFHPRIGDIVLMQMSSPVPNHAAVYVGENLIFHHRTNKRSGHTPIGYCVDQGYCRTWLRKKVA